MAPKTAKMGKKMAILAEKMLCKPSRDKYGQNIRVYLLL